MANAERLKAVAKGARDTSQTGNRMVSRPGESTVQGTPILNHLSDHSGRDFAQSSSI